MAASREFQVFAKPAGPSCNLGCRYCYYLEKGSLYPDEASPRMPDHVLETYTAQHIAASPDQVVRFSWHGGEPTLLGIDFFRRAVRLQRKHLPPGHGAANGIQTNGTLLDDEWCRFLAAEGFTVGLSLDGPPETHDPHRITRDGDPTHHLALRGYRLLRKHGVPTDVLCVVNADNARHPLKVYGYLRDIGARHVSFLPMVEQDPGGGATPLTVSPDAWGGFLCAVFDEWRDHDIGRVKVQIIEEATRTAFHQEHSLCIFRPTCGDIPVVEHNGDFYACDHYVDPGHLLGNIAETPLHELLESPAQRAFGYAKLANLPLQCLECEVRSMCNGECPKNRFAATPDGEPGLNYLCEGYRRFFNHVQPFVSEVAALYRRRNRETQA